MVSREGESKSVRKEAGIISRLISSLFTLIAWLIASLIISIIIEWIGMTYFWKEEGLQHATRMLEHEHYYLNQRLLNSNNRAVNTIVDSTKTINQWINKHSQQNYLQWLYKSTLFSWLGKHYNIVEQYIEVIPIVAQVFIARLAIILFSLPAFLIAGVFGAIDGLAERDLRRWGGGRESSNVYNIARKSVLPVFISACVLYLSLPVSIHPGWVIMPFVLFFGFSVRVSFERLKKYF
ncbi:MAG: TIGR03747 family integrating conjugative element membrane protein [Cellvibrionaceae bacterium]